MQVKIDSVHGLLTRLAELHITVGLVDNQLRIDAPPGTLSEDLKQALHYHKNNLVESLKKSRFNNNSLHYPKLNIDPGSLDKPFPLTDAQWVYWEGRNKQIQWKDLAPHVYLEVDCRNLHIERFEQSFDLLIERHDMLRGIIESNGQQRILPQVPAYQINVQDFCSESLEQKVVKLACIREKMSHQVFTTDRWPLFDVRASQLSEQNTRVNFSWGFLQLDIYSLFLIFREWYALYKNLQHTLPAISMSYRDYVLTERKIKQKKCNQQAHNYWWTRLDHLPIAPQLPIKSKIDLDRQYRFIRRCNRIKPSLWQLLKLRGQKFSITPFGILLVAFAEVLTIWSKHPHFSLGITLFDRLPLHEDIAHLIGDFTSLLLLEVDNRQAVGFKTRAANIQQQFTQDFKYRQINVMQILRQLCKRCENSLQTILPVVFTSILAMDSEQTVDARVLEAFGPIVCGISQTTQVYLNVQVMEDSRGIYINWDAVEEVFMPGVLDEMFSAYCQLLEQLAVSETLWQQNQVLEKLAT